MRRGKQWSGMKIASKIVNKNSTSFSLYGRRVWFGYDLAIGSFAFSLFFLLCTISFSAKIYLDSCEFLFFIALGSVFLGWHPQHKQILLKDIAKQSLDLNDKRLFSQEALEKVSAEKQKRIAAMITSFKWCGVIISFLVIGSIGDPIKDFLGFDSIVNLRFSWPIAVMIVMILLSSPIIVYYVNRFCTFVWETSKDWLVKSINNGLFVSKYVELSAAEEIIKQNLSSRQKNEN